MNRFWNQYPFIQNELIEINKLMHKHIGHPDAFISEPIISLMNPNSKMLRPAFLLLAAQSKDYDQNKARTIGAGLELLHIATLIHDDIVDDAHLRRGVPSVQSKYGKDVAVYSGDFVLAKCFSLLHTYYDQDLIQNVNNKVGKVCEGELKQFKNRYNSQLSVASYLKIVSAKTASFFALCMYIGAHLGGHPISVARLFGIAGLRFGIAFQIIDDCLDYEGDENTINKNAQNDLREGLYTLPLLMAMKNDSSGELKNILSDTTFSDEDIQKIRQLVIENNGVVDAQKYANKYTQRAIKMLKRLPIDSTEFENIFNVLINRLY